MREAVRVRDDGASHWQWDEYLAYYDPCVDFPWQMSVETRRAALAEVLREAVYSEAMTDGAEVEERR